MEHEKRKSYIEIIDGVAIDWSLYKGDTDGRNASRARKSYIDLCMMLHNNGHILESDYVASGQKILINFNCGHPSHLIAPREYKSGKRCPLCYEDKRGKSRSDKVKQEFIQLVESNGHKLLSEYTYNRSRILIDFNCGHSPSWVTPKKYKKGGRCIECGNSRSAVIQKNRAKDIFINIVNENGHILESDYVDSKTKVLINYGCGHPSHWIKTSDYRSGVGCPQCINKGEGILYNLLLDMGFKVETQKTFNELKSKYKLRYDFYLPEHNLLIELDGEHHRKIIRYSDDEEINIKRLKSTQYRDKLKDSYAIDKGIHLLRIKYNYTNRDIKLWKQLILDKINEIKLDID